MLVVDALGRQMELQKPPARIVSLVPSLTELLFDLGVKPIAASDYCLHPSYELEKLPRVGGQKDPDLQKLLSLRRDFVVVAKEENQQRDVEMLEQASVNVFVTDSKSIDEPLRLPSQ